MTPKEKYRKKYPEKRRVESRKYYRKHKDKILEQTRVYKTKHPNQRRGNELKRNYGLSLDQYDQMFEEQDGVCAICGGINKSGRRLSVDHDHKTGKVRGLLCQKCNAALGFEEWLKRFANRIEVYLGQGTA